MYLITCVCDICIAFLIIINGVSAETEITQLIFGVTVQEDMPICVNASIEGPMRAQQKFQIMAISSEKGFGNGATICIFNSKQFRSTIRLKPKPGKPKKQVVVSKIQVFNTEMQGKLVCKLGLDMQLSSNDTDVQTMFIASEQRSYPIATCAIDIYLKETEGTKRAANYGINSYKPIVYGVGGVLVIIIIAQAVAMFVYGSQAVSLNKIGRRNGRSNARSSTAERGTVYEDVIVNNREGTFTQSSSEDNEESPPKPPKKPTNKISPSPIS